MHISYNWLKSYVPLTASAEKVGTWLTQAGLEVVGITPFVPLSPSLVIGETVSCVPHPNADKLKKLVVDIGQTKRLQIICGAANVAAGQKVIVAPVGATLTSLRGEKHKIKRVKIRGEYSEGMICAAYEIGAGEDDEGILVLDTTRPAGTPATTYFSMPPDDIFEIDITPNMGYACSHLGVAREIAAMRGKVIEKPTLEPIIASDSLPMHVEVTDPSLCPRYTGVVIKNVQVAPSPWWLRSRLHAIGLKPVNNVVDITNFVMHALGQPLHAFDYDKIAQRKLFVGPMKRKATMQTLHGDTLALHGKELMVYDEEGPLCLAGILGGMRGQVHAKTQSIFLESACFTPTSIAQSARIHGIHTDASFRFERGTDIEMPYIALQKAVALIQKLTHGVVVSTPIDHYPIKVLPTKVPMRYPEIDRLLGKTLPRPTMHAILKRLDIALEEETEEGFTALVPPYRTDVKRAVDVVEEIIRIHGYGQIPTKQSYQGIPYPPPQQDRTFTHNDAIVRMLVAQGFLEMKTNTLMSHARLATPAPEIVQVVNPLSLALDTLRPSMLYTGLEAMAYNVRRHRRVLRFFELGKVYSRQDDGYREEERLALFLAGEVHEVHWDTKPRNVALHDLYGVVTKLLRYCGIPTLEATSTSHPYYDTCIALKHNGTTYAHLGTVASDLCAKAELKAPVFFTEIPLEKLRSQAADRQPVRYQPIPQTPAIVRDISLALPQQVTYTEIVRTILATKLPYSVEVSLKDLYQGKELPKGTKSYTIRLRMQGRKTFREADIRQAIQRIEKTLQEQVQATIRT